MLLELYEDRNLVFFKKMNLKDLIWIIKFLIFIVFFSDLKM